MRSIATTLVVTLILPGLPAQVLWDINNRPARAKGLIADMNRTEIIAEAKRLLGDDEVRVGSLVVYASEADRQMAAEQGGTDCTFENWRATIDRRQLMRTQRCPTASQALKVGDDVLLREVDAKCYVRKEMLLGRQSPLTFAISGSEYEVLDVISTPRRASGFSLVGVYVRTRGPVTTQAAMAVLTQIQVATNAPNLSVTLRGDEWFPMHCEFPVLYFFNGPPRAIPTATEFIQSKEAVCTALESWPVQCY